MNKPRSATKWAEILQLKPHRNDAGAVVPHSWELTTGWKTSLGVFKTICVVASGPEAFDRSPGEPPPAEVTARGHVPASRVAAFAAALPAGFQARIHLQGAFTLHGPTLPSLPDGVRLRPLRRAEAAPAPVPGLTRRLKDTFGAALAPQRASFDTRLCNDHR